MSTGLPRKPRSSSGASPHEHFAMTDQPDLMRRNILAAAGACFAMMSQKASGADMATAPMKATFTKDSEATGMIEVAGIHQGKGKGKIKFFWFDGATAPTYFLIYELAPGGSEGTHVHFLDNRNKEGSFDEYYYVVSGQGQMELDGKIVPVSSGDHVHTPLEVAHGIENTHATEPLRVFLTFIKRGDEPFPAKRSKPKDQG
jgi:oxalate decarboxylase/phosphoglucose isomerase-like protein (cupin superfamily)